MPKQVDDLKALTVGASAPHGLSRADLLTASDVKMDLARQLEYSREGTKPNRRCLRLTSVLLLAKKILSATYVSVVTRESIRIDFLT